MVAEQHRRRVDRVGLERDALFPEVLGQEVQPVADHLAAVARVEIQVLEPEEVGDEESRPCRGGRR